MSSHDRNQERINKNFYLRETEQELIKTRFTLAHVLTALYRNEALIAQIYKASGDSSATSILYLNSVIQYLEIIIATGYVGEQYF